MNIQEYISSGIIESYVLGLADEAERAEYERMAAIHPEIREAQNAFELSLEAAALQNTIVPPVHIKSKLLSAIDMDEQQPGTPVQPGYKEPVRPHAKVVKRDFTRLIAAAAVILLLMSTALNFYFFSRYREYNEKYVALIQQQTELATHNQILQTRLLEYERAVEMMKDPNMYVVKMPAAPNSPDSTSATTVYWDTRTKDVYLAVNRLPEPAAGQQYQLWAIVDGKPVDAGVFEMREGAGMSKMKNIPKAEAFAVTLEKKGGSAVPSLDKLYVMGRI
ncbi:MAG: anti-sigma factor [Chitinophagaceae bacterium]|nr:anti-sigma factor [Chitinophagaceae bacterium]